MWVLVAVRLILPVTFESRFSLMPELDSAKYSTSLEENEEDPLPDAIVTDVNEASGVVGELPKTPDDSVPDVQDTSGVVSELPETPDDNVSEQFPSEPANDPANTVENVTQDEPKTEDQPYVPDDLTEELNTPNKLSFAEIASVVWLIGTIIMVLYSIGSWVVFKRKVAASIHFADKIYVCDYIDSPFILGVIRPKIYIPSFLDESERELVIAHEMAHIKRGDHIYKPLGFLLLSLHWFNPIVWISYTLLCRDIEIACDERAIKDMDPSKKKEYVRVLLDCSISRKKISACPLAFGEVSVKDRIKNVLNHKKPTLFILIAAIVVIIVLSVVLLTDPKKDEGDTVVPSETEASETDAPETEVPETDVPEAEVPETEAPETDVPETEVPETDAPETEAPETEVPETEAPETDAPETEIPETDAPETDAPETDAPETDAPETEAPETEAPETDVPETDAPETDAPETDAPATDAPATAAPETDAPETEAPETDAPETDAPETDAPETDAPETDAPEVEEPKDYKELYADLINDFKLVINFRLSSEYDDAKKKNSNFHIRRYVKVSDTLTDALAGFKNNMTYWHAMLEDLPPNSLGKSADSFGYILYDLDYDGVEELFWVRKDHKIIAIFTFYKNEVKLLDCYSNNRAGYIGDPNPSGNIEELYSGGQVTLEELAMTTSGYELYQYDKTEEKTIRVRTYFVSLGRMYTMDTYTKITTQPYFYKYYKNSTEISEMTYYLYVNRYPEIISSYWTKNPINDLK